MTDAQLDALFGKVGPVEPPVPLQMRILAEVGVPDALRARATEPEVRQPGAHVVRLDAARAPVSRPRTGLRWGMVVGALAMAAGALVAVRPAPSIDAPVLVPRGVGEQAPTLDLRVAVDSGGRVERLAAGTRYAAGDTLLFRVASSVSADVELRRASSEGGAGAVIYAGHVPAGETDLPVGYVLEPGEVEARFVLSAGGASVAVLVPAVRP